ncbi:hypothetical protein [Aestuariivirga sp.]|uniref:hypothetical protein n=1 Tax=Aestuariivirga sp. TaxID=2650926 RepID=UPI003BA8F42E
MATTQDLLSRPAERLVLVGFRNLMAATELGDMACWEAVWQHYIAVLGSSGARRMVGELQYWARSLRRHAERPLTYYPHCCRHLCHDECMALSMVSAAQAGDETTGLLAARYLTGTAAADRLCEVWQATLPFAQALNLQGQAMFPVTAEVVESIFAMQQAVRCGSRCRQLN